ncbi:uncharacterized protein Bfra_012074 [Botrytis fragariae]|uniref:Uncharacterized protein n=1 Tax=Botrytis fragariae TaxID=1964551 RepID=A0A8H6EE44_9HELO|nr:uncharacterized protein Bfra_012074 [Botrytis fragariae]KAF5868743.1 hypothetical protein Bfra_012074 [Botrytis fragariae]
MDKSHATYLSPQDLLKSYQPSEVPFSVPSEEEISEQEGENDVLLIPIAIPDASGELYSAPLDSSDEIIELEEEISIIPIDIPEASSISYSSPSLEEPPIEEYNGSHEVRLNAPASSSKSHTPYSIRYELPSPRSTIITQKDIGFLSDAGVRGSVSTVCHGTFHSQPATLILFTFIFRSGDHGFRFKNASVKIDFSRHSSSSSPSTPSSKTQENWTPTITALAPRKIYGLPTTIHQTRKLTGEISLQVPLGPTTLGPSTSLSHESSFSLSHRYSLTGNLWSQPHSSTWDSVYWDLKENKQTKGGIPDRVDVGVVVCRGGGAFQGEVRVEVDTPVMRGVWGWPWGRGRPVVFVEGVETGGERVRTRRFEELGTEDWRGLVGWEGEWVDVVVGGTEVGERESGKGEENL